MNHYAQEDKVNFTEEQIKQDIDLVFSIFDFIRLPTLIGGEPFLHNNLPTIISHVLEKNNYGILIIVTNGVCKISHENIMLLRRARCRVHFSDYSNNLDAKQRGLFSENISKMIEYGIIYRILKTEWILPPTLFQQHRSSEQLTSLASDCRLRVNCRTVLNGVYYPCDFARCIHQLRVADYSNERVILDKTVSPKKIQAQIIANIHQPFYQSCDHCDFNFSEKIPRGEQGFSLRYQHLGSK
jgi:hypothetical protein